MKKLLALLLALMMLFSVATVFAGCEDSGKKKSSSSKNDDEDEDEDEEDDEDKDDEDEDEDEDKDGEEDEENKEDEDNKDGEDEEDDKNGDEEEDVTEPAVTDPEPTEPDPTEAEEEEFLAAPYETFDESLENILIGAQILSGNEYKYFEIGIQKLGDEEAILYYFDEAEELMMHYNSGSLAMYVFENDSFVLDTTTSEADVLTKYQSIAYIFSMFVDFPSLMGDAQYEWLGEEDGYAAYNVYMNGALVRTIYMDTETGLCSYVQDQNGNDMMWIEEIYEDVDLASYIL